MSRTFKIILTFVIAVVSFVVFLLMSFPLDSIANHFLASVEERTQGEFRITVQEMHPSLVFDSVLEGVVISKKSATGFSEIFSTKHLEVNFSLFSLLSKSIDINFEAEFAGGELSGNFKSNLQKTQLELNLDQIKIEDLSFLQPLLQTDKVSLQLAGEVSGDVFMVVSPNGLRDAEAEYNLSIKKLIASGIKISNDDRQLPPLTLSTAENAAILQGSLVNSQIRLHEVTFPGPDLDLEFKGKLNVKEAKSLYSLTRYDLKGRFAFSDPVLEALPELGFLAAQKGTDGYYPLVIAGRAEKPSIRIGEMDLAPILGL